MKYQQCDKGVVFLKILFSSTEFDLKSN